ncbi:MAG: ion transporter [Betaproteobacteria bacterium]|nr:ion transporter [Betaproteobacteria bacterium]
MNLNESAAPALPEPDRFGRPQGGWRLKLFKIVFESDTRAGRLFDIVLIWAILASVAVVMLDSVATVHARHKAMFNVFEWGFTALFTVEYICRLACVRHPLRYATSVFGIIDLLALLPTYLAFFDPSLSALIDIRILRLLRVFRILKLGEYVAEYGMLLRALYASRRKIAVFLSFVLLVVLVMGTLMYVVEGPANGFTSIPTAVYWAITTMTTVGFGDITPKTDLGRFIASVMMLVGWGTLAVPTGIVSAEFVSQKLPRDAAGRVCGACQSPGHALTAKYCQDCGAPLP